MSTNTDNTTLSVQTGGDAIRDLGRTKDDGTTVKTQVVALDVGGQFQEKLASELEPVPVHDPLVYAVLMRIEARLAVIEAAIVDDDDDADDDSDNAAERHLAGEEG